MDRDLDHPDSPERPDTEQMPERTALERVQAIKGPPPVSDAPRSGYELGDRTYNLNKNEGRMLFEIGRFRSIEKSDLLEYVYGGNKDLFERDLTHLHRKNLVRIIGPNGSLTKYVVLTKPGKQLAQNHFRDNPLQELYAEAVKPKELRHDGALYHLYEMAAERIQANGGKPIRVVLDFELKRRINRDLAKKKDLPKRDYAQLLQVIAERENLKIVRGKIPVPDIRLEYENSEGELAVCDLELVTEHYRAEAIAEKRAAGFQLYSQDRKGRAIYGPDLMGGILSL